MFGVQNWAEYDTKERILFRRRVFPSYLDGQPITGIDIANMILDQSFAQLYDDDAVGLCCLGILQLVILGVESRRVVPDWMLRLANDRIAWDKYPWSSYVWPTLYSQLRNANVKRWSPLYVEEPTNEDDAKKYLIFGYTWAFKVPSHMGRPNLQTTIETQHDVDSIFDQVADEEILNKASSARYQRNGGLGGFVLGSKVNLSLGGIIADILLVVDMILGYYGCVGGGVGWRGGSGGWGRVVGCGKFNLEANAEINFSFKLSSFDFAVDITDDVEGSIQGETIWHPAISIAVENESLSLFALVAYEKLWLDAAPQRWSKRAIAPLVPNMTYEITDWAAHKVAKKRMKSATWVVKGVNEYQYQVSDGQYIRAVNLQTGICECRKWQLSGLPCGHVIAITRFLGLTDCVQYVADWFKKPKYQGTYSESIHFLGNMQQWEFPHNIQKAIPPRMDNPQPGRPKNTNRIQSQGEEPRVIHCSRCKQAGHKRDQCSQPFVVQPPVNIRTQNDQEIPRNNQPSFYNPTQHYDNTFHNINHYTSQQYGATTYPSQPYCETPIHIANLMTNISQNTFSAHTMDFYTIIISNVMNNTSLSILVWATSR
ncbi:transposase, MuDR, MULE transposase domain protein [Tanacetum coccineum]